jgi:RNA-splicing ligase RtcB
METIGNLRNWASDIDPGTIQQALKTSRLPILAGPMALMPDAHVGIGSTVGSVIPTENAIIPAAVGVDIGCGMAGVLTDLIASDLPDNLDPFLSTVERVVPAGVGKGHSAYSNAGERFLRANQPTTELDSKMTERALSQFGTLGSGNHFFEVCLDESDRVWIVLHSGSRGIGNQLAQLHIKKARQLAKDLHLALEDPDLAYFMQDTPEFQHYIGDMLWAQNYAYENREQMLNAALREFFAFVGTGRQVERINCHHNYSAREVHDDREIWITRKGAIKADRGDLGIIPGSMGARSYIVEGLGNPYSWNSCSHGAGRRFSRAEAKRRFSTDDLAREMEGKTWLSDKAASLVDEIPSAYKDVDQVMADQRDLVRIRHTLHQILNFKGA